MRPSSTPAYAVLFLLVIASLALMSGAGSTSPASSSDLAAASASGIYVRNTPGSATINGRRVIVRAFMYNDFMPPTNPRNANLGNLLIVLQPNDVRGLPSNITRVTAEITQGRAKWRGTLPDQVSPFADANAPSTIMRADYIGPSYFASGIRTFSSASKVNITLTFRAGGRDHRVTLRNVEVGAVY